MLDQLSGSYRFVTKSFLKTVKFELENLILNLIVFGSCLFIFLIPFSASGVFGQGSILFTTFLFISVIIFFTLLNAKRIAYFEALEKFRSNDEVHFFILMESFSASIGKSSKLALVQSVLYLALLSLLVFSIGLTSNQTTSIGQVAIVVFVFVMLIINEFLFAPVLLVAALTRKSLSGTIYLTLKKALPIMAKRLVYLLLLLLVSILCFAFAFLILPPLLFFVFLYPVMVLSHLADVKKTIVDSAIVSGLTQQGLKKKK